MIEHIGNYLHLKCDLCKTLICEFTYWAISEGDLGNAHAFCNKCFERLMK